MPDDPKSPGVYIRELPNPVRPLVGVSTSIAAFVGHADKGPVGEPKRVFNLTDFERLYGSVRPGLSLGQSVSQFFLNGGTDAYILRVGEGGEAAAVQVLSAASGRRVATFTARQPGADGNHYRIGVSYNGSDPANLFTLTVTTRESGPQRRQEIISDLSADPNSEQYFVKVIGDRSRLITAEGPDTADADELLKTAVGSSRSGPLTTAAVDAIADAKATDGKPIANSAPSLLLVSVDGAAAKEVDILSAADGVTKDGNGVRSIAGANANDKFANLAKAIAAVINPAVAKDAIVDVAAALTDGKWFVTITSKKKGAASAIRVLPITDKTKRKLDAGRKLLLGGAGSEPTGTNALRPPVTQDTPFALGTVPTKVHPAQGPVTEGADPDPTADPAAIADGLRPLETIDLFNLLVIPETYHCPTGVARLIYGRATALCRLRRAFFIADLPRDLVEGDITSVSQAISALLPDFGDQGATYYPPIADPDPAATGGTIAGVYARTDSTRGVWKSPAGIEAVLRGVQQLGKVLTEAENAVLNPLGINALRTKPVYGNLVWGARSGDGADDRGSQWKYLAVRRTALFIEESLFRGLQWAVFEGNDETLWSSIRVNVETFMRGLFRQGAFQGKSQNQAFFVKCDRETNPQSDIDKGIVNVHVGFAPLKPAEFVVVHLQQMAGQSQT